MTSGVSRARFVFSSWRSATVATVYPCSRNSHDSALAITGCPSATTTRPPRSGVSIVEETTQSFPFDVAAAQNRDGGTRRLDLPLEQRRNGDGAAGLHDELHSIEQQTHGAFECRVVDENDVVDESLMMRERDRSNLDGKQTVREPARVLELDRTPCGACTTELGRTGRLDADDARVWQSQLDGRRDSRAEATTADRNEHRIDRRKIRRDLEADGALPRDDSLIVVWRYQCKAFVADQLLRTGETIGRRRSRELHARAESLGAAAFRCGDGRWHHDGDRNNE